MYYDNKQNLNQTENSSYMNIQQGKKDIITDTNGKEIQEFRTLGFAGIIYAVVFVFCLYKNFMGVTNVLWVAATVGYMAYMSRMFQKNWRIMNTFISVIIVLLGISNFVTGNYTIVFFNYIAIVLLIIANMMYLFFDVRKVNVTQHFLLFLQMAFGSIGEWGAPVRQLKIFLKNRKRKKSGKTVYIIIGVLLAIPVFIIMLILLVSADQVFKEVFVKVGEWLSSFDTVFGNIIGVGIMLIAGYVVPYAFTKYVSSKKISVKEGKSGENEPIIAIIVAGVVSLLYVLFSVIQIIYLFLGKETLPSGYSYAEYAREGFFQLLFVCTFNVILVLVGIEFFKKSKALKIILSVISICTFVMIASSAYRMIMYICEYGLTFTRVFVLWALIVITLIMFGLLYQLLKQSFKLFRYCLIVVSVCFTVLSLSHVDYFIAEYDLNMYEEMNGMHEDDLYSFHNYVDYNYLMRLSTDAAPVMKKHMDEIKKRMDDNEWNLEDASWAYPYYEENGEEYHKMTVRNFNISRYMAR